MQILPALVRLAALIDRLNDWVGRSVGWLAVLAITISAYNAVMRKAFSISSNGLLEIQWYLFGAVFLLGAAYTLKENAHIRIDILAARLSARSRAWIDILGYVFFILPLVGFVVVHGSTFAYNSFIVGEMSNDVGGLIRWPAKSFVVIGFVLLGLQVLAELIKRADELLRAAPACRAGPETSPLESDA